MPIRKFHMSSNAAPETSTLWLLAPVAYQRSKSGLMVRSYFSDTCFRADNQRS